MARRSFRQCLERLCSGCELYNRILNCAAIYSIGAAGQNQPSKVIHYFRRVFHACSGLTNFLMACRVDLFE